MIENGGEKTCISSHNSYANTIEKICPEEFEFKNGRIKLHGFVMKPANYKKGKKYPGILVVHGGLKTVYASVFYHEMQFFAQKGYFVFLQTQEVLTEWVENSQIFEINTVKLITKI